MSNKREIYNSECKNNVNKILIPKEAGLSTYFTYLCRQKYLLTANIRIILKLEFSKK